jgi:predicted RNA methylase
VINKLNKIDFKTTPYHYNLLKDNERLIAFYEAISSVKGNLLYDLGTGCGILSYFAKDNFEEIISIEKNYNAYICAKENLKKFNNIIVLNKDIFSFKFEKKADYIVCEMLDTGLIDEEQIPVLNKALTYLNDDNHIIPKGVINILDPVYMQNPTLVYEDVDDDYINYDVIGNSKVFNKIYFKDKIKEKVSRDVEFNILENSKINALKLTTITLISEDIICGPTPMLNPPLFIPLNVDLDVFKDNTILINLSYTMGGGLNTIKTEIKRIY